MPNESANPGARAEVQSKFEQMFGAETPEKEAPVGDAPETAPETEAQGAEATEQESTVPTQGQPEEVEVEIDGAFYLVPKAISDRFIHHADYTRKTQDIAEMRRSLSAEREAHAVRQAFENSVTSERHQLALVEAQLDQFKSVNWHALETDQLLKTRALFDQLKDHKQGLEQTIKTKREEFDAKVSGHMKDALESGNRYIQQHIKGFDKKMQQELMSYGVSEGYTSDEMSKIVDPRIVVTLWKAQQWDQLKNSRPGIENKAARAAPVVRPGATQRQPSRVTVLQKAIKSAKGASAKRKAGEDYFTERFNR